MASGSGQQAATVLVVDDDPGVADTFARMLKLEGLQVVTALDTEAGLRAAARVQPEAIILDLRMPLRDGVAFLRALRATPGGRATPVAIVTGDYFLDEELSAELRALGADVRFKPLWLDDLVALTRGLLQR